MMGAVCIDRALVPFSPRCGLGDLSVSILGDLNIRAGLACCKVIMD
jgi:hypothetical protein